MNNLDFTEGKYKVKVALNCTFFLQKGGQDPNLVKLPPRWENHIILILAYVMTVPSSIGWDVTEYFPDQLI